MQNLKSVSDKSLVFIVFFVAFAIYISTLAPTYLPPDNAEFALCIQYLGICHPPGFFLYVLLGKLFTILVPFGSLIYKTNLLSALYASLTVLLVFLSMLRLNIYKYTAALLALIFAFSSTLWAFATNTDVFTFGSFLLSLIIYCITIEKTEIAFLLLGLLTSHFPNSFILIAIINWFYIKVKKVNLKEILIYNCYFFFGLLIITFLLFMRMLQNPIINWGHVNSLSQLISYITRKEFGGAFLISNDNNLFSLSNFIEHIYLFSFTLLKEFGLLLPIVGGYVLIKKRMFLDKKYYCFYFSSFLFHL